MDSADGRCWRWQESSDWRRLPTTLPLSVLVEDKERRRGGGGGGGGRGGGGVEWSNKTIKGKWDIP